MLTDPSIGDDGSVCCTIQCYAYDASDTRHYENFDYIDDDQKIIKAFEPNRWETIRLPVTIPRLITYF
jgi:hypothetical protein